MPTRSSPFRACQVLYSALFVLLPLVAQGQAGDTASDSEKPPAATPAAPPPSSDVEEIVVVGAESDSSADFAAGDSVTGFGAEDLAALGASSIADLASFTPNLEIVTAGATTPTFFIRGVGLNDFNPTASGAVAVYQDDVAINSSAIQLGTLFDVENVNVLRGPQGTGKARNASAGAIKIYSRKPTGDTNGFLRTDFGNYRYQDYEGAFETPIFEDLLAGRFAFRLSKRDGTLRNGCGSALPPSVRGPFVPGDPNTNQTQGPWSACGEPVGINASTVPAGPSDVPAGLADEVNDTNNWAARGTLLFQPTLDVTFLLNAHGAERDELTRLGQSMGTNGALCRDPSKACVPPFPGIPVSDRDPGGQLQGVLGGPQGASNNLALGYQPREIRERWGELAPCLVAIRGADGCNRQPLAVRQAAQRAMIQVANELARDLDSDPWHGDFNHTGPTTLESYGFYLKGDIALPFGLDLETTSAFDTYDRLVDSDLDFSPETFFHIRTEDEAYQVYQDISVSGALGETGAFQWEVGGWFLREELEAEVDNDLGQGIQADVGVLARDYRQELWSAAGYAYFSYDFWEDFSVDGGWRYNWETKELEMDIFSASGTTNAPSDDCIAGNPVTCELDGVWNASTGTIRLLYRFREDTHATWRYTRGWKPGSFNATASQNRGPTTAEPEELDSFEFGLHASWFEGRLGMDGSLFYYAYSDYQIFTARQFLGGTPEFVLLNAKDAEVYGSEVDATARPWAGAYWNVRFSWLESQFLDFLQRDQFFNTNRSSTTDPLVVFRDAQNSGNSLLNSPRFKVSLTTEQSFPVGRYGSLTLRYDGVWTHTTYYDASEGKGIGRDDGTNFLPDDTIGQRPYWLHNVRASWRSPDSRLEVAGWVRNLENKAYKSFAFDGSSFRGTTIYFVGDPRTYGVSVVATFF